MPIDYVAETVKSGITPIEIESHAIRSTSTGDAIGYRSILRINSLELGTLYPGQYRMVTNRNAQCVKLATVCYNRVSSHIKHMQKRSRDIGFMSVYFPVKMLLRGELEKLLEADRQSENPIGNLLCMEFSLDILLTDMEECVKRLNILRSYGVKLMLSGFGDEFCPIMRLHEYPFDYVVLDQSLTSEARLKEMQVQTLIQMVEQLGMAAILENPTSDQVIGAALEAGCRYYCHHRYKKLSEVAD